MTFWLPAAASALLVDLTALVRGKQGRNTRECWAFWCGLPGLLTGLLVPFLFLYGIGARFEADATGHKVLITDLVLYGVFSLGSAVALSRDALRRRNAGHRHD